VANPVPSARFTYETLAQSSETRETFGTVEFHFSGSFGTDMQKIRIIFFSLKIGYICSLKRKKILQTDVLGYIFIYVQI
jgi:hypothetical protein